MRFIWILPIVTALLWGGTLSSNEEEMWVQAGLGKSGFFGNSVDEPRILKLKSYGISAPLFPIWERLAVFPSGDKIKGSGHPDENALIDAFIRDFLKYKIEPIRRKIEIIQVDTKGAGYLKKSDPLDYSAFKLLLIHDLNTTDLKYVQRWNDAYFYARPRTATADEAARWSYLPKNEVEAWIKAKATVETANAWRLQEIDATKAIACHTVGLVAPTERSQPFIDALTPVSCDERLKPWIPAVGWQGLWVLAYGVDVATGKAIVERFKPDDLNNTDLNSSSFREWLTLEPSLVNHYYRWGRKYGTDYPTTKAILERFTDTDLKGVDLHSTEFRTWLLVDPELVLRFYRSGIPAALILQLGKPFVPAHHSAPIHTLSLSPDGTQLASGDEHGALKLWEYRSATPFCTLDMPKASTAAALYRPNGKVLLALAFENNVTLESIEPKSRRVTSLTTLPAPHAALLAFSGGGTVVATAQRNAVTLWGVADGKQMGTIPAAGVTALALDANGGRLALSTEETTIIWDIHEAKELIRYPSFAATALLFKPNGSLIAAGTHLRRIELNATTPAADNNLSLAEVNTTEANTTVITKIVAEKGLWMMETNGSVTLIASLPQTVTALLFTPAQKLMLAQEKTIALLETDKETPFGRTFPLTPLSRATLSNDGAVLTVVDLNGTAHAWNLRDQTPLSNPLSANQGIVFDTSKTADSTLRLTDAVTGRFLAQVALYADGAWAIITNRGYFAASDEAIGRLAVLTDLLTTTPINLYREKYHRPDTVADLMQAYAKEHASR